MTARRISGWWRLWIAVSVVWMSLAVVVGVIAISVNQNAVSMMESTVNWSCDGYAGRFKIDLRDKSVAELIASKYAPGAERLSVVELTDRCIKAKSRDYEKEVSDKRIAAVAWTAVGAIVPPLVLLALGALVGWIVRGDRADKSER